MLDVVLRISVLLPDPADTDSTTAKLRRIKVTLTIRLRVLNIDLLTAFVVLTAASFRSSSLRLTASLRCH